MRSRLFIIAGGTNVFVIALTIFLVDGKDLVVNLKAPIFFIKGDCQRGRFIIYMSPSDINSDGIAAFAVFLTYL